MRRKRISSCLTALAAVIFSVSPVFAADVVGKWYGQADIDPVIVIEKAGSDYSGLLVDIDTTRSRALRDGEREIHRVQSVHKTLARLTVAGGHVRFTILKEVSANGDIDYERDQYDLNLSEDGQKLIGTVNHLVSYESAVMPFTTATPITLFSTDGNSRNPNPRP